MLPTFKLEPITTLKNEQHQILHYCPLDSSKPQPGMGITMRLELVLY